MAATSTSTSITLRGSTDIVVEFFDYAVNSILYQRGIYPPESFKRSSKYGLAMMTTTDDGLTTYLGNITRQLLGARKHTIALLPPAGLPTAAIAAF